MRLWTSLAAEDVIVIEPVKSGMTASSPGPGTTPPTQLLAVFQLPPAALPQVIVDSSVRPSRRSGTRGAARRGRPLRRARRFPDPLHGRRSASAPLRQNHDAIAGPSPGKLSSIRPLDSSGGGTRASGTEGSIRPCARSVLDRPHAGRRQPPQNNRLKRLNESSIDWTRSRMTTAEPVWKGSTPIR